ncbi:uncharacterized protein LOC116208673 [Punica granatum]|uniref:Uncharacterized protein LOC116208673 n=2 Tax=Punica granatum TaxID=22663 RepID=A0A6P8DL78_PUNGR|nr:uncharacterized protein LOC116208673 [Punica granatum]
MQPPNRHLRINLSELKARLVKRLGPERSDQYFDCLSRLLSLRLSKFEFDKLCLKLLGKENLPLHNQLIRAVLQNACSAKIPPPMPGHIRGACLASENEPLPLRKNSITSPPLNGERNLVSRPDCLGNKIGYGVLESGTLKSCDSQKPLQHHQELMGDIFVSGYNRGKSRALVVEGENNVYEFSRSQLQAPVGTPCHPGTARSRCSRSYDSGGLLNTDSLREQMQHIATYQGLEGVTVDCASLLNIGLNSYLKTLIGSCIQLARTRSVSKLCQHRSFQRDQLQQKLVNGVFLQEDTLRFPITMSDFKAAMELRPQELGEEDWPLLLEKISVHAMKG